MVSFGHKSGLIATNLMQFYRMRVIFFSKVNNGWIQQGMSLYIYIYIFGYMCFNGDVQALFECGLFLFHSLCFPKLKIMQISVSEALECYYFFSEH